MGRVVRHPGKPTSGRYVYRTSDGFGWYWQCDLHDEDGPVASYHTFPTQGMALANALLHAVECPFNNELEEREVE